MTSGGEMYVHQAERDQGGSVKNWNPGAPGPLTDLGGKLVERYVYTPYGQVSVFQESGFGGERSERQRVATGKASMRRASGPLARPEDVSTMRTTIGREGDQDVDSTDKGTPGTTCSGGAFVGRGAGRG